MSIDAAGFQKLLPLCVELAEPGQLWDVSWELARQIKLGPGLTTFMFKLIHQILPTAVRVSRILPNQSPHCQRCKSTPPVLET
jgi:hypothetical protein